MKFKINGLKDTGDFEKERVVIEIMEEGNVGELMVATTVQQGEDNVSSKIENAYWIPDQDVKKGDLVVIYTKVGKRNTRDNEDNTSSYFFYIGMTKPLYEDNKKTVAVFNIEYWSFSRREEPAPELNPPD